MLHRPDPIWRSELGAALDLEQREEPAATAAKHRQERDALDRGTKALLDRPRTDMKARCKPYRAHRSEEKHIAASPRIRETEGAHLAHAGARTCRAGAQGTPATRMFTDKVYIAYKEKLNALRDRQEAERNAERAHHKIERNPLFQLHIGEQLACPRI